MTAKRLSDGGAVTPPSAVHGGHISAVLFALLLVCTSVALAENHLSALEGRVVDPSGAGAGGAIVVALNTRTGEWRTTNAHWDGKYKVEGLPDGDYEVIATSPGFVRDDKDIQIRARAELRLDFHVTLYSGPGTTVRALHQGERPGVFEGTCIRGEARGPSGQRLAGVKVTAENLKTDETQATTSNSRGLFVLMGLPVGIYRLKAEASGYLSKYRLASPMWQHYGTPQAQFHLEPDSK